MERLGRLLVRLIAWRWLTTLVLILMLDVCTYMAFRATSGPTLFPYQDKATHLLAFALLTVTGHLALNFDFFPGKHRFSVKILVLNWMIWLAYGLFIEWSQSMLHYRRGSAADLVADILGMILGSVLVWAMKLYPAKGEPGIHEKRKR